MSTLRRGLEPLLNQLLDTSRVVILEGGRGVGKTTLARLVGRARDFQTYFDLSDPADRSVLRRDPYQVLAASPAPILVDEAQLEPELPVAVKRLVDAGREPGQVLLTGSTRIGRGALGGADPLAGRAVRLRLHSFTQSELHGSPSNVVDTWWGSSPAPRVVDEVDIVDLYRRMTIGGLPAVALDLAPDAGSDADRVAQRQRVLTAYFDGVLTMALAGTRVDRARLHTTFRYLASNPGQILNINRAASELSMRAETVQGYLDLCRSSFLLDIAPAHRPTQHKTITAHPRVFASDVGFAAWAAEATPERLLRDSRLSGGLLENLVATEVAAQAAWAPTPSTLLHWRDSRAGREVDLVLRRAGGEMLAIEVKSASSVSMADARGLVRFGEVAGERLARGIMVYTGRVPQQLDDRIWAVPLGSLISGGVQPRST